MFRSFSVRARGPLALALAVATLAPLDAAAQRSRNPFDAEVSRRQRTVERSRRDVPGAMIALLELRGYDDDASPGTVYRALGRLAGNRRLPSPVRQYAAAMHAHMQTAQGDPAGAQAALDALGYVRHWRIVGSFDNEGKSGFERAFGPEAQRSAPVDAEARYAGREREIGWRVYPPDLNRLSYVDFDAVLRPNVNTCAYAETFVQLERAQPITLHVGAGGAHKVWFNGEPALQDDVYRNPDIDRSVAIVAGRAGWNRVLVKNCVASGRWGFYLRVGDRAGDPIAGLRVDPMGATEAAPAPDRAPTLPAAPTSALAQLQADVADDADDADAHERLARFLYYTRADDRDDNKVRQLAERAVELRPTVERLVFASDHAENRAERMRFARQARELAARDVRVKLLDAELVASGPDAGRALRMLEAIPMSTTAGFDAAWLRASLLEEHGLPLAGLALIEEARERSGGALLWVARAGRAYDGLGRREQALQQTERVIAMRYDDVEARNTLLSDAVERDERERMQEQAEHLRAAYPGSPSVLAQLARLHEGIGEVDDAFELYRTIIATCPEEASYHVQYGRALLRHGREGPAADVFRAALELRPQDAGIRQQLERIAPTEREDEAYAVATEEILERRRAESEWPATMLQDLTVNTVYENGLSASFRQVAWQVHSEDGARRLGSYPIVFEPGAERVEIRSAKIHRADGRVDESVRTGTRSLGDPRYRIYYDTAAMVVQFPDLEPGDTVELRYRVESTSRRNEFNDYYGDLRPLQGNTPVLRFDYVLRTPKTRAFHFNRPALEGLTHEVEERDDLRIHHFAARDIAPLRGEPRMPGITEVAPYLHVSTYESWDALGRWWWGLAQDQLRPDDGLRRTVRELVQGAANNREKVARIYGWVLRNTRYVGLEFGIHGFKPYRVTQVVQRGFGDCKDKASLLYVMFQLAGIDARIALVRTRTNGDIADAPASLAAFNHAIAYVPEFDLFLDGTTETMGTNELPPADQGVMTLLVGPETVELRRSPELPATAQRHERTLAVTLAADGSATVEGRDRVLGATAGRYRSVFEAAGTRDERLQRELRSIFPGVEVQSSSFEDLDDFEVPVSFTYEATVPQFAERAGADLQVAPWPLGRLVPNFAVAPTRRHPMDLGSRYSYREERTLRLASGLRFGRVPDGGEARSPFGSVEVRYARQGSTVTITTELVMTRSRIAPDDYPAFRRWAQEADALLRQRVIVEGGAR